MGRAVDPELILRNVVKDLYDGVPMDEVRRGAILSARALIEEDPAYSYVTARLLLHSIRHEVLGEEATQADMRRRYAEYFPGFIDSGIAAGLLDPRLRQFDLQSLGAALDSEPRPQVRLPWPADAIRPVLPPRGRSSHRAPAGLLYARRDGLGPERSGA